NKGCAAGGNALIAQKAGEVVSREIGAYHTLWWPGEAAAQGEACLAAGREYVKVAPLDRIAALCGVVPWTLARIELCRGRIAAPDDSALFAEENPLSPTIPRRVHRDDLVGEDRVRRGMQRVAQSCAVLAGDMGHH